MGAYRDDAGKPYVLPSIREAESRVVNGNPNHEYAAITGDAEFVKLSLEFAYGPDSAPLVENRVAAAQVLSGTGGLRVCAQCDCADLTGFVAGWAYSSNLNERI